MARIQYQPAGRSRGFKPRQLSAAGISRMREESNRMISEMERNRRAEKEQRDRELQAIKENNAYIANVENRNFQTEIQNLKSEANQQIQGIQVEAAEAQAKQAQTQNVLNLIGTLSKTAGQAVEAIDAELLKQDTAKATAAFLGLSEDQFTQEQAQRVEDYQAGESLRSQGTIKLNSDRTEYSVLANESPAQQARGIASNPGLNGRALQIYNNLVAYKAYTTRYQQRTADAEFKYTAADGTQFTGAEALKDPYLAGELQRLTLIDVVKDMGITEPLQLAQAQKRILQWNETTTARASTAAHEEAVEIGLDKAEMLIRDGGTVDDLYVGFNTITHLKGNGAALDFLQTVIENPNTPQETIDRIGGLVIDGEQFSTKWEKNRWLPSMQKRQQNLVKLDTAERKYREEVFTNQAFSNIDEITAFIDENPDINGSAIADRFTEQGFTVPPAIKSHISTALKQDEAEFAAELASKFKNKIIDDSYISSIVIPRRREQALKFKEEQEISKYGPNYVGLKKSFNGDARALTKINDGGANTSLTEQVNGRIIQEFKGFVDQGFTPDEAAVKVRDQIQEALSGAADATNPFYFVSGVNNRRTFPNIETSGAERAQQRVAIDEGLLELGIGVLDQPYLLATENQMDTTYKSYTTGNTLYPPEILRVAEMFGIKPSEAYNTVRAAQNKASGKNKPFINGDDSLVKMMDLADARSRRLIQSGIESGKPKLIERSMAGMGVIALPRRSSMGIGSFNPATVPSGYGAAINQAAQQNNIPPEILAGLIATESNFNPIAVSPAGARGLAQFMPPTAAEFGVDVNDPMSSIDGAARYLRYLTDYFKGDMNKAIYAYNGGMGNIERFGGPIPGNQENQEYLTKVLNNANRFR